MKQVSFQFKPFFLKSSTLIPPESSPITPGGKKLIKKRTNAPHLSAKPNSKVSTGFQFLPRGQIILNNIFNTIKRTEDAAMSVKENTRTRYHKQKKTTKSQKKGSSKSASFKKKTASEVTILQSGSFFCIYSCVAEDKK